MTGRPDDEALLERFARWLSEARAESDRLPSGDGDPAADDAGTPDVGLGRLVEEFTALRHELKLQTRSARGLQEQAEALLPELRRAMEQFRAVEPKESQAAWSAGRPLAEALADLDEALERGRGEIERAGLRIFPDAEDALAALHAGQSWLIRRLVRPYHERALAVVRERVSAPRRAVFEALLEGYDLIQGRLRRALNAEGIVRIDCVGRPVDPALMTVIGVVDDPGVPVGQVVEEVRPGYTWQGRLLRYAEVRAARGRVGPTGGPPGPAAEPAEISEEPARED